MCGSSVSCQLVFGEDGFQNIRIFGTLFLHMCGVCSVFHVWAKWHSTLHAKLAGATDGRFCISFSNIFLILSAKCATYGKQMTNTVVSFDICVKQ